MEYIVVKYPKLRQRNVYVDGQRAGLVDRLIRVEEGSHRVSLAGPKDFAPAEVDVQVSGTSPTRPATVTFEFAELED